MGQIQIFSEFHDAQVLGIVLAQPDVVNLIMGLTEGATRTLVFQGVRRFRAENFREGNTILEISATEGQSIDSADVAYAYDLELSTDKFIDSEIQRLKDEAWLLIKLEPSFGCFAVCICRAWIVREGLFCG